MAGCERKDNNQPPAELLKTWKLVGFVDVKADTIKAAEPQEDSCYILTFKVDGTLDGRTSTNQVLGTYTINVQNNEFKITQFGGTKISEFYDGQRYVDAVLGVKSYSLSNNELRLYYDDWCLLFKAYNPMGYDKINITPFVEDNYYGDALQLYMYEIDKESTNPNRSNVNINSQRVTEILKLIQAVYNLTSAEQDTVFNIFNIHGYYCYGLNSIYLRVNTDLPEIQNLAQSIIPTGEAALDGLLSTYAFDSVKLSYSYPQFPWLTLYTKRQYNMIPIVEYFDNLPSITAAEFNKGCIGDGNTIKLKQNALSATLTFSIGWGDCPAGCTLHHYWEFEIRNGAAYFVSSYGSNASGYGNY